jgi:hypothetical protein
MGYFDRVIAGRQDDAAEQPQSSERQANSEVLRDTAASTSLSPPSDKLYDPYEGISSALGGKKAAFRLPQGPEFVFAEEAAVHRRSWGENLQYYTGLGYLGGASQWTSLQRCAHRTCISSCRWHRGHARGSNYCDAAKARAPSWQHEAASEQAAKHVR